jgi:hypothetical protein
MIVSTIRRRIHESQVKEVEARNTDKGKNLREHSERENPLETLVERINSDSPGKKEEPRQP